MPTRSNGCSARSERGDSTVVTALCAVLPGISHPVQRSYLPLIRPIFRSDTQPFSYRILPDILPLVAEALIRAQEVIKETLLPMRAFVPLAV